MLILFLHTSKLLNINQITTKNYNEMKKLIAIVMMMLPMIAWGQQTADSVWFELQPDGMFLTKDGKIGRAHV